MDTATVTQPRSEVDTFRAMYDTWAPRMLAWAYRRTFDAEAAADVVAETFAVAWQKRRALRDPGSPGAWLFAIGDRELKRWGRRKGAEARALARLGGRRPDLTDQDVERIEALADVESVRPTLDAALGALPDAQREAVRLRVIDDLPYEEVAARLGCSPQAARVRVHRGLARMAHLMEDGHDAH